MISLFAENFMLFDAIHDFSVQLKTGSNSPDINRFRSHTGKVSMSVFICFFLYVNPVFIGQPGVNLKCNQIYYICGSQPTRHAGNTARDSGNIKNNHLKRCLSTFLFVANQIYCPFLKFHFKDSLINQLLPGRADTLE